jgi:hypothetical protein
MNALGKHPSKPERGEPAIRGLPVATPQFRRRAWRAFQRALDPLSPARPLKQGPPKLP